jgi:hypothetical protein
LDSVAPGLFLLRRVLISLRWTLKLLRPALISFRAPDAKQLNVIVRKTNTYIAVVKYDTTWDRGARSAGARESQMPDIITANRLTDGVVVFQTVDEAWSEDFSLAAVQADPQATADALARAKQDEAANLVVDPYAVPVEERNGHFAPKALREAIRAAGPTNRRDLGKQAAGLAPRTGPRAAATEADHVSL